MLSGSAEYVWPGSGYPPLVPLSSQYEECILMTPSLQAGEREESWTMTDNHTDWAEDASLVL